MSDDTKPIRGLKRPPAIVDRIGQLTVSATAIHRHDAFKALRICEQALSAIITKSGGTLPAEGESLSDDWLESLRAIDEDTIDAALDCAYVQLPITSAVEAVELVNCVLDIVTGERPLANAGDEMRIARAASAGNVMHFDDAGFRAARALRTRIQPD